MLSDLNLREALLLFYYFCISSKHTVYAVTWLQELPEQWNNVKKQSVVMKQNVAPLQAEEVSNLRRKLATFDVRQHEFRESFREKAPFTYSSTHAYVRINRVSLYTSHTCACTCTCTYSRITVGYNFYI